MPETDPTEPVTDRNQMSRAIHTTRSSYREAVLEHLFTGALLQTRWLRRVHAEVLRPSVDDAGYDLVVPKGPQPKTTNLRVRTKRGAGRREGEKEEIEMLLKCLVSQHLSDAVILSSAGRDFYGFTRTMVRKASSCWNVGEVLPSSIWPTTYVR